MNGVIWLVSYPKSGNTWLRLALRSLRQGGRPVNINEQQTDAPIIASRALFDDLLGVDSADLGDDEVAAARPALHRMLATTTDAGGYYKVHDAWTRNEAGEPLFPKDAGRAVYLVRDPRDVAVSFAHHMNMSIDEAIGAMANPDRMLSWTRSRLGRQIPQLISSWSNHVLGWLDQSGVDLLLLRYEDMQDDPQAALARVAAFCGLSPSPQAVAGAVAATRFDTLRTQEESGGFIECPTNVSRFFRRGVAEGWRDSLTPEQAGRIVRDHALVMARLGYAP